MRKIYVFLSAFLVFSLAGACNSTHDGGEHNHSPYAGQEKRLVKALSDEDVQKYLDGDGLGFAKVAELNGFPGPKHVLENKAALNLTAEQEVKVEESFQKMRAEAKRLGRQIVDKEKDLDTLFAGNLIEGEVLREKTREIAELQGSLRNAHLAAHLDMKKVLSPDQVESYKKARGYAN